MKLNDLYANKEFLFESVDCSLVSPMAVDNNNKVDFFDKNAYIKLNDNTDVLSLYVNGSCKNFNILSNDGKLIRDYLSRGFANICVIKKRTASGTSSQGLIKDFFMDIVFFYRSKKIDELCICLPEKCTKYMMGNDPKKWDYSKLPNSFMLSNGVQGCFAYTDSTEYILSWEKKEQLAGSVGTPSVEEAEKTLTEGENDVADIVRAPEDAGVGEADEDHEAADVEDTAADDIHAEDDESLDGGYSLTETDNEGGEVRFLMLYGEGLQIKVRVHEIADGSWYEAVKVQRSVRNRPAMCLGYGKIKFVSEDQRLIDRTSRILGATQKYLKIWDDYANLEGDFLLQWAQKVGTICFSPENVTLKGNGSAEIAVDEKAYTDALSVLRKDDVLYCGYTPDYLSAGVDTWKDYRQLRELKSINKTKDTSQHPQCSVLGIRGNVIVVEANDKPKSPFSLLILGDEMQIKRREDARRKILSGESANHQIGLVIEGNTDICVTEGAKHIPPLSAYTNEKLFSKNPPTDTQRTAIDIALNTPDIAVIQGPPGTGKTTVIKAIIERLNEISDKSKYSPGEVLVTSSQHDAVYNVIASLEINGMPTMKFGRRSGVDDETVEKWDEIIYDWCDDVADKLLAANPSLQTSMEQSELIKECGFYKTDPSDEKAVKLLTMALDYARDPELAKRIEKLRSELSSSSTDPDHLMPLIRGLRVTPRGFADDGPVTAWALLDELEFNELFDMDAPANRDIVNVLKEASKCKEKPDKQFLKRIRETRDKLLERLIPPPFYSKPTIREDVVELANKTIESMMSVEDAKSKILRELYSELEHKSDSIKFAMRSYSYVFAATAQQSLSKLLWKAKNCERNSTPEYDTVIIDEAARVNPGDLMIPLSQAKRRVILVGDHRQLPHIYDDEIVESMGATDDTDIKISMFEHLLQSARTLEAHDGKRRTITLDQQFRTHPLLGEFINENFYRKYGEGFKSPLKAELFSQPISEKPLVWVDIPVATGGAEQMSGTSKKREYEARYIAARLREYLEDKSCKGLKFGVITFYSAQVAAIRRELGELSDHKDVRIGSVDSFQGLEFDVVFLSVVRTSAKPAKIDENKFSRDIEGLSPENEEYKEHMQYIEELGRKHYGFLTSENRLCVALSRQKKLLIVVGDSKVFTDGEYGRIAKKCVPAMANLYALATKEGEVVSG